MLRYERELHGHILANWGVVSQLVCEKHNLEQKDLDVLLFFYGNRVVHFKRQDFYLYRRSFPHFKWRFSSYIKKGLFAHYRRAAPKQQAVYTLGNRGIHIVHQLYRQLFGDLPIRTDCKKTSMYKKDLPLHRKAVESGLVEIMNRANKQQRLSPE